MEKNYYKMSEKEHSTINEAMEIACYECEMFGDFIETGELMNLIYELVYEYKRQKEEFEDYKQDVKENCVFKEFEPEFRD